MFLYLFSKSSISDINSLYNSMEKDFISIEVVGEPVFNFPNSQTSKLKMSCLKSIRGAKLYQLSIHVLEKVF